MDCLFCKISRGELNTKFIFEDEEIAAFYDINPQAPQHILIIPKKHIATVNDIPENDAELIGKMVLVAKKLANKYNVDEAGYRLVFNCNEAGGQAVYHIHLHLLAGRAMSWPPG